MSIRFEVEGPYALFARPELHTERVSYDIITPSAARGILESIFWHPGLKWHILEIRVCNNIRFTNIRRNEVKAVASARSFRTVMERGEGELSLVTAREIQQRAATLLKNVRYVIEAEFEMTEKASPTDNPGKFQEITKRRLRKGQCYSQPYLGCREFPCRVKLCEEIPLCPDELKGEHDMGYMLYDMDYSDPKNIQPMFFRAVLHDGVLKVPRPDSEEVKR